MRWIPRSSGIGSSVVERGPVHGRMSEPGLELRIWIVLDLVQDGDLTAIDTGQILADLDVDRADR